MNGDAFYYTARSKDERERAAEATDPKARKIHLTLAKKYAELAQQEAQPS